MTCKSSSGRSERRYLKASLISAATLVVLAFGALAYLCFGDLSVHKDRMLSAASEATGFDVTVDGPFSLDGGRKITLHAGNARIANPGWPDGPVLATFGDLRVVVDTWSAVFGPLEIDLIELDAFAIVLQENSDGAVNWTPAAPSSDSPRENGESPDPIFHRLVIRDLRLEQKLAGQSLGRSKVTELQLTRTGANDYQYQLHGVFGRESPDTSITTAGRMRFGAGLSSLDNVRFDFDDAHLEVSGPTSMSMFFSGFAEASLDGDRPHVKMAISSPQLEVIAAENDQSSKAESEGAAKFLFDASPLEFSGLNALNLDADIQVASATVLGNQLNELQIAAALDDAHFNVSLFEFVTDDGGFSGTLDLVPADGQHKLQLDLDARNLRLTQLDYADQDLATVPPLSGVLTLSGQGASLHDIMASSNGQFTGRQGSGQLNMQAMNSFFSDFLSSIVRTLNPAAEEQALTGFDCGIYDITIESGVAEIKDLAMQTEHLTIVGSGSIRFDTEAIDINMHTGLREGLGLSLGSVANAFVKLGGTLSEPALQVDAAGSATSAGAAVATGGLSLLVKGLWDRVTSEADICSP